MAQTGKIPQQMEIDEDLKCQRRKINNPRDSTKQINKDSMKRRDLIHSRAHLKRFFISFLAYLIEWIANSQCLIKILNKLCKPPRMTKKLHIAFIPDGNRRYFKKIKSQKRQDAELQPENDEFFTSEITEEDKDGGKWHGGQTLQKIVKYLEHSDEVTVYTYSKQNFMKRKDEELSILIGLLKKIDLTKVQGKIKFIGETNLLKDEDLAVIKNIEACKNKDEQSERQENFESQENKGKEFENKKLNLCLVYSGLDELKGKYDGFISKPDIIIRTGYQQRLSDYLLKQSGDGVNINFIDCFWPELTEWHVFLVVLKYFVESWIQLD